MNNNRERRNTAQVLFKSKLRRMRSERCGTAATELAILLPLIVGLCLVGVDLGRFGYTYVALSQATQAGANYAASHKYTNFSRADWESKIEESIKTELAGMSHFDPTQLSISLQTTEEANGLQQTRVDVTYPFPLIVAWPTMPSPILLRSIVTTRQFQ